MLPSTTLADFGYPVKDFVIHAPKHFKMIWLSNLFSVPDEGLFQKHVMHIKLDIDIYINIIMLHNSLY